MDNFLSVFVGISITIYLISFFTKNIITARRTGESVKAKSWKVQLLTFIVGILYLITCLSVFVNRDLLFTIEILNIIYIKVVGAIFIIIALIIGLSTLKGMRNSWRMGITKNQKTDLILDGFFRFCRNPYFLSYHLIFLGVFSIYPTIGFLIFYILFAILTHLLILDEEAFLLARHGKVYLDYKKKVNRYLTLGFWRINR